MQSDQITVFPTTFEQQRLWFIEQLAPGTSAYHIPAAIELCGVLDVTVLQRSVDEIVRRHEILRTTFTSVDGQPVQVIDPTLIVPVTVQDVRAMPSSERDTAIARLLADEVKQPFNVAQGPLIRVAVVHIDAEEHILVVTMHHIVSDIWSLGIFLHELSVLYNAFITGTASVLPELSVQYGDFAVWQREQIQGDRLDQLLSYWRAQLAGAPPLLLLPTSGVRPAVQTFRGAAEPIVVPAQLTQMLKVLSRRERVSLFMTLLAAFQALLGRCTGQHDIVVSTGVARRTGDTEVLIGCFINILLLRTSLEDNPRFVDLLARVREVALGAYAHQDLPFEKLVKELQPKRDLSYNPLTQVMFILQNAPLPMPQLVGLAASRMPVERTAAQLDLDMQLWEVDDRLEGFLEYNTDLCTAEMIRQMLGHYQTLLEAVVTNPAQRLWQITLLSPAEQQRMLVEWNRTTTAFPHDMCLHALFEAHVERQPDAPAVLTNDGQWTYRELNRRANQVAYQLRALGIGPEVRVGLCVDRSVDMVVGIMAILKAGGAFVPLDPTYPQERLAFMLEDSQVAVLVTQRQVFKALFVPNAQVVYLDRHGEGDSEPAETTLLSGVAPENLAYVIYTSGSTGRPKGIAIRHQGVVNNVTDLNRSLGIGPQDRVLGLSSLSFDMCVYEVLGLLGAGGAIILPALDRARDPTHWIELIQRYNVSVWNSAPALLEMLVSAAAERPGTQLCSLRVAILGGDWVPLALPDQIKALSPGIRFIALGGATEASIHSIIYPVEERDPNWMNIPYGRPMANQQAYLLDGYLQPVPIGVPGELYLGGIGLARGYFDRPDLTAERFVPNPFLKEEDGRMKDEVSPFRLPPWSFRLYRTGDLARYWLDGTIELLGRIDHQVKIRGFRIELGEITAALRQHPAVSEAVVALHKSESGYERLVAYVVPTDDRRPTTDDDHSVTLSESASLANELRQFLAALLPDYMVPAAYTVLAALPLSPNGKVDRRALPPPDSSLPTLSNIYVMPRTPLEEALAGAWSKILAVQQVGVHDNFFEIGGHSLLATQASSWVHEAFQVELPLRTFFAISTVAEQAAYIEATGWATHIDVAAIANVLVQLQRLSDEEVRAMLVERESEENHD